MLDMAGILISSLIIMMVIIRAVRRDQAQPWFQTLKPVHKPSGHDNLAGWRRK